MAADNHRLPWEDEVVYTDGTSCGFEAPTRDYRSKERSFSILSNS